jgi:carboxylesterase
MGEWLSGRGISVVGPRLPGHGTRWEELERTTWFDWEREAEQALEDISSRSSTTIGVGLSMGGAMVLHLAAKHPDKLKGIVVINCDLVRPEIALAPVARLFRRSVKGVGNDIKKPGQNELPYDRIPLAAVVQLNRFYRTVRKELPSVKVPLIVFSSPEDHVVKPSVSRYVLRNAGSPEKELITLNNSYHVATLDNDAEIIFQRVLEFANSVATGAAAASA